MTIDLIGEHVNPNMESRVPVETLESIGDLLLKPSSIFWSVTDEIFKKLLHPYVINGVPDRYARLHLLMLRLEDKPKLVPMDLYSALKTIKYVRNVIAHSKRFFFDLLKSCRDSIHIVMECAEYLSVSSQEKINEIKKISDSFIGISVTYGPSTKKVLSEAPLEKSDHGLLPIPNSIEGTLRDLKVEYRERLKKKKILILDGKYADYEATFLCWSGTTTMVLIESVGKKILSLDRKIKILN